MRERPRGPEDVPFARAKEHPPTPEGKKEEVFELNGFFRNMEMETRAVGDVFFRFPSITDIEHKHIFSHREAVLEEIDARENTNHLRSATNVIEWIQRGVAAIDEAKSYESDPVKHKAMEHNIEVAREAFRTAQEISKKMGERYYPHIFKKED